MRSSIPAITGITKSMSSTSSIVGKGKRAVSKYNVPNKEPMTMRRYPAHSEKKTAITNKIRSGNN